MAIVDSDARFQELAKIVRDTVAALDQNPQNAELVSLFVDEFSCPTKYYDMFDMFRTGKLKEWVGNRKFESLRAVGKRVECIPYEHSVEVHKTDVTGETSNAIPRALTGMLANIQDKLRLSTELLVNGFSRKGYDNVNFFSSAHPNGPNGSTQSNVLSNNPVLSWTAVKNGVQQMQEHAQENGTVIGINPNVLMVGPKNWQLAKQICGPDRPIAIDDNGALDATTSVDAAVALTNALAGTLTPVLNPYLTGDSDDYWFLIDSGNPLAKALMLGVHQDLRVTDNLSEPMPMRPVAQYGVDAVWGFGLAYWQVILGSKGSGSP